VRSYALLARAWSEQSDEGARVDTAGQLSASERR
jgi:hypothetical protein